jgi:hypothetical protein
MTWLNAGCLDGQPVQKTAKVERGQKSKIRTPGAGWRRIYACVDRPCTYRGADLGACGDK